VLLWSHGVSGQLVQYTAPPPDVIKDFARAGWDVVKLQRNNTHEAGWSTSGTKHVAHVVERIAKAKADGYKHIIAAGQSYGGAISLEASARTDQLFGVIAFAPGHGSDACGRNAGQSHYRIADNLQRLLVNSIAAAKAPRNVVLMADGDECQGTNEPTAQIRGALTQTGRPFIHFDASMPVRGHSAASTEQFRRWYGKCLVVFLSPDSNVAPGETACPGPATVPRFLLPEGYEIPDREHAVLWKLLGGWSGSFVAANGIPARDICVVFDTGTVNSVQAYTAFGAGPEKKDSMVSFLRTFHPQGDSYVHQGNQAYRIVLTPDKARENMGLSITSGDAKSTWTGTLKRGC
jgi:pimeloyl-ACP methyl ester carboxylesterase